MNINEDLGCGLLDSKSVRVALRAWDSTKHLNTHPLTELKMVQARQQATGYSETLAGKGSALREVLRAAIEALRPNHGSPNSEEKSWRAYIILTKQFLRGRTPDCIATELNISRRTFYDEQEQAIEKLVEVLCQWETLARLEQVAITDSAARQPATVPTTNTIPFMPPPRPSHMLIGRDSLLHEIKSWLLSGHAAPLGALYGLPGVGKTALAIELAHDPDIQANFGEGILWVDLGRQPDIPTSLMGWALALNIPLERIARCNHLAEYARLIHAAIGLRRMLLIIDDAWQLDDALAFKVGGPNCAYLVTTRLASIAVDFAGKRTAMLHELSDVEGLSLLTQLAPEVVATEPEEARSLVRDVGGLPLALMLMGGYLRRQSYAGQERRLQQALLSLRRAETRLKLKQPQSLLEQQQNFTAVEWLSLQASIRLSDGALNVAARQALRDLALFLPKPNTFSEEAALTVAAMPAIALDTLVDYGLVECLEKGRYTLHQTIVDYAHYTQAAVSTPDREGVSPAAIKRFVGHFTHYMADHLLDPIAFDIERQNLLTALALALKNQLWEEFVHGTHALYSFLMNCGLYLETAQYLSNVLALMPETRYAERYLLLLARKQAYHALGRREAQRQDLDDLAELADILDDDERRAEVALWRTVYAQATGDNAAGTASAQKAMAVAQAIPDLKIQAESYFMLGVIQRAQGNYANAQGYFEQALCLYNELDDRQSESEVLLFLGLACEDQDDQAMARIYFEKAQRFAGKSSRRPGSGMGCVDPSSTLQEWHYSPSTQRGLGYAPNFF